MHPAVGFAQLRSGHRGELFDFSPITALLVRLVLLLVLLLLLLLLLVLVVLLLQYFYDCTTPRRPRQLDIACSWTGS